MYRDFVRFNWDKIALYYRTDGWYPIYAVKGISKMMVLQGLQAQVYLHHTRIHTALDEEQNVGALTHSEVGAYTHFKEVKNSQFSWNIYTPSPTEG